MSDEQPEQIWEKGQKVIIFTPYGSFGNDDHNVSVHPIESVAPKSFVASHYRFRKDKLAARTQGGFHGTTWLVCRMDDERAPYLLAERSAKRQMNSVSTAQQRWTRDQTVENAADLQVELHGWVEAEQERVKAEADLRTLRAEEAKYGNLLEHR